MKRTVVVAVLLSLAYTNAAAFTGADVTLTLQGGAVTTGNGGTISGAINLGNGGLSKLQGGRWTLSGSNLWTGPTTIGAGTLLVDGSITGTSNVNIGGSTASTRVRSRSAACPRGT